MTFISLESSFIHYFVKIHTHSADGIRTATKKQTQIDIRWEFERNDALAKRILDQLSFVDDEISFSSFHLANFFGRKFVVLFSNLDLLKFVNLLVADPDKRS